MESNGADAENRGLIVTSFSRSQLLSGGKRTKLFSLRGSTPLMVLPLQAHKTARLAKISVNINPSF